MLFGHRLRASRYARRPWVSANQLRKPIMRKLLTLALIGAVLCLNSYARAEVSPAQAESIAKEAFIYGYPMVIDYGTIYAFSVDKNSPQYKAPFNQINNQARVFTPADTTIVTPNSD